MKEFILERRRHRPEEDVTKKYNLERRIILECPKVNCKFNSNNHINICLYDKIHVEMAFTLLGNLKCKCFIPRG